MAYDPTLPTIEKARLDAIEALLVAGLPDLNTALKHDNFLPSTVTISADMVTKGDPTGWPVSKPPVLICVCDGGGGDELDIETELRGIDPAPTQGYKNTVYTNILMYVHPDAVKVANDPLADVAKRQELRARLSGWARAGVLNTIANRVIPLGSREYSVAPNYDKLDRCVAKRGYKGLFDKSFGGSLVCYGAHIVHEGWVM